MSYSFNVKLIITDTDGGSHMLEGTLYNKMDENQGERIFDSNDDKTCTACEG